MTNPNGPAADLAAFIEQWKEDTTAALRPVPVLKVEDPAWRRGTCPCCGSDVVSNAYRIGGIGYRIFHECLWATRAPEERRCNYRIEFAPGEEPRVIGADPGGER